MGDIQDNAAGRILLEPFCSYGEVISTTGQAGDHVRAVGIGAGCACKAAGSVSNDNFCADHGRAGFVHDGAADVAGVLCARGERKEKQCQQEAGPQARNSNAIDSLMQTIKAKVFRHGKTSKKNGNWGDDENAWKVRAHFE